MKIKKTPGEIWKEYQNGISYNTGIGLYENVERNNNFFNDKQWEGVNAPDLDKPVFNFLKPVVSYYVAMLISDDIAVDVELEQPQLDIMQPDIPKIISQEIDNIIEQANMKFKNRRMVKNCAIDGDGCFYIWFDSETEQIKVDLIDNTNVLFGNPSEQEAQQQPYIMIVYRRLTEDVRDEAEANGFNPEEITPDSESHYVNSDKDNDNDYTTVILKMWKEKGEVNAEDEESRPRETVHFMKCTEKAVIKKETDTEYEMYPLAWMSWENMKNSYHGVSPITGKIPNQIFVNKIYAMAQLQVQNFAFPKVIYNKSIIPNWSNKVGQAIAANNDPSQAVFTGFRAPDMSGDVMNMAEMTIRQTKDMMGASDAALGNVKPDNTSAIIAVQKASGMPLDIQRMDFYNFVESCVRIFVEIMRVNYGMRSVSYADGDGNRVQSEFDFSSLISSMLHLKIDIGQGSYWSELMQVQTLDALMSNKVIPDALTYLEAVPDGYIKNKNKIIERIKEQQSLMTGMPPEGMMPTDAPVEEMPMEEMPPEPTEQGSEIDGLLEELAGMSIEEAATVLDEMDIPEDIKAQVLEVLENGQM